MSAEGSSNPRDVTSDLAVPDAAITEFQGVEKPKMKLSLDQCVTSEAYGRCTISRKEIDVTPSCKPIIVVDRQVNIRLNGYQGQRTVQYKRGSVEERNRKLNR